MRVEIWLHPTKNTVVSEKVCKPIFFLSLYLETLK